MKILAVQNLIDMINSSDSGNRDLAISLIESGELPASYLTDLYDYFFIENEKWLYRDIWVDVRRLLSDWKKQQ